MTKTYIHYGSPKFDRNRFQPIKNISHFSKPHGGLWASDIKAKFGWKDLNDHEHFCDCAESNSFKFQLKESANVLTIWNWADVEKLPQQDGEPHKFANILGYYPDWEEVLKLGYDAVEVYIWYGRGTYDALYGWDCDSILVLNPDVVIPVE